MSGERITKEELAKMVQEEADELWGPDAEVVTGNPSLCDRVSLGVTRIVDGVVTDVTYALKTGRFKYLKDAPPQDYTSTT